MPANGEGRGGVGLTSSRFELGSVGGVTSLLDGHAGTARGGRKIKFRLGLNATF